MSVINDMLRDLEARKAPDRDGLSKANIAELIEPESTSVFTQSRILAVVVLLLAAALGTGIYVLLQPSQNPMQMIPPVTGSVVQESGVNETEAVHKDDAESIETQSVGKTERLTAVEEKAESVSLGAVSHETKMVQQEPAKPANVEIATTTLATTVPNEQSHPVVSNAEPVSRPAIAHDQKAIPKVDVTQADNKEAEITKSMPAKQQNKPAKAEVESRPAQPTPAQVSQMITLSPDALDEQNATEVRALFDDGRDQEAYRQLYNFIEDHDTDLESRITLTSYLLRDQRLAEAGDVISALPIEQNPQARLLKARWYMANGLEQNAVQLLESDLPVFEFNVEYYELLASYYQQFGEPEQAITIYSDLIRSDSQRSDWWAGLAIALDRAGQYQDALTAYKQALQLPGLGVNVQQFVEQRVKQLAG